MDDTPKESPKHLELFYWQLLDVFVGQCSTTELYFDTLMHELWKMLGVEGFGVQYSLHVFYPNGLTLWMDNFRVFLHIPFISV